MRKQFGYSIRPAALTSTTINKMTITEDEIDNYVDTLTNTINNAIAEKVPTKSMKPELYWCANRNQETDTSEETPEETLAKD